MSGFYLHPNSEQEIIDTTEEDIIVTNHQGIIVKASKISGKHYDINPIQLLGRSVYELENEGIFSPAITPLVLKKQKKVVLVQTTPADQKVLITGIPIFNESNEIEYVISYSYEVSELLIIQDYLKELKHEMKMAKEELILLRKKSLKIDGLVVENRSTRRAYESAKKASPLDVSVVIYGEHGTGKTTLAKNIHNESARSDGSFIIVDCETIPEALFEQKLLGTDNEKIGLLSLAHNGTLFLKGIDKLEPHLQAILARVLQEKKYSPLYSTEKMPLDVRVISSSEVQLNELPSFQKDLFYLLHIVPIELKPLRERKQDLSYLIPIYLQQFSLKHKKVCSFRDDVYNHLLDLNWLDNHHELLNVIERLVVQSTSTIITMEDLPIEYRLPTEFGRYNVNLEGSSLPIILEQVEKEVLINAQERYRTTTEIAKYLGISQPTVVRKLQKYGEEN
ncbi:sigma 54-interacting transcriptional regulator [Sporosarcina sp. Marseille-Q4063]|uniref:sigma 54-interacting transcriptional regulator n=1 Tax=Sporosarcina sp. Marseille-Q4063 TaxID=2810514 RepID=UPI001BAFC14C|nr:sigma 54-interacting transcriptional regulator [Sporosarcina sp. Marseille-Q4063]QUW23192.1 sigma 54-interacting transcriptional regulator [Sporosarcina sp. Marseille-Q4063]